MALLPPRLLGRALSHNQETAAKTFGTFGVTILRSAEIVLTPLADTGFEDGFLAIGNMHLPSTTGSHITSASFAAPAGRVDTYVKTLNRAMDTARQLANHSA
jgi:hypothetical protein